MSSLLSILLVTQADQSSPSLAFAWPPRPQPTLRLDRPVYKREQSRICGSDPSIYSTKLHADRPLASVNQGRHEIPLVSGSESDHRDEFWTEGSSDETPSQPFHPRFRSNPGLGSSSSRVRKPLGHRFHHPEDEDDNAVFPGLFYERHPSDSSHLNTHRPLRSVSPTKSSYLGFNPDEWADMLTPRIHGLSQNPSSDNPGGGMISGRKLELVIDALAIIAHPVLVTQKPTQASNLDRSIERGRTRTRSGEKEIIGPESVSYPKSSSSQSPFLRPTSHSMTPGRRNSSSEPSISTSRTTEFNSLELHHPSSALPNSPCSPSKPLPPGPISQLTRMMTPSIKPIESSSSSDCTPVFLHASASASSRSNSSPSPVALPARCNIGSRYHPIAYSPLDVFQPRPTVTVNDSQQVNELSSIRPTQLIPIQSFTLALIIDTPPACHLSQHLEVYYKDVVLKLTAALKHLERDSSYLTREVQHITQKLSERRSSNSSRSTSQRKRSGISDMMKFIEQSSDLARALARTFVDLKRMGSTSITLDGQLDLDLLLHRELLDSNTVPENWLLTHFVKAPCFETGDHDRFAHLESWKSLLLLEDPQVLIEQTALGSLLRDFIAIIKPALTLSEYKFLLDTDSNTIAEMTCHLLHWRKAKMTDAITLRNCYQLNCPVQPSPTHSSRNTLPIATLQNEFSAAFPNLPNLVTILSLISRRSRQPFSSILPILDPSLDKSESMAVLVWLLKRDLLVRERTHVRIKIDRRTKLKVALWEQEQNQRKGSEGDNDHLDEQSSLSPDSHSRNESNAAAGRLFLFRSRARALRASSVPSDPNSILELPNQAVNVPSNFNPIHSVIVQSHHEQEQLSNEDQPSTLTANPSSVPGGCSRHYLSRGSRSPQPTSMNSITSSDELLRGDQSHTRLRQRSVQSDFYNLSEPPNRGESGGTTGGVFFLRHQDDHLSDSIIGEPGQATCLEQTWLDEICADKSDSQICSFNLAFRYFNGRYPLEEIMSRSGLSRKALNEVLNEFKSNLILLVHP